MKEVQSLFWDTTQRFLQEYEKKKLEKDKKPLAKPTQIPKEQTWLIKRDMPRMPKDGKR